MSRYTEVPTHSRTIEVATASPIAAKYWTRLGFSQTHIDSIMDEAIYGIDVGINGLRQNNWSGGFDWNLWGRDDAYLMQRASANVNWQSNTWYARVSPVLRTYRMKQDGDARNNLLLDMHVQKPFASILTVDLRWHGVVSGSDYIDRVTRDYQLAQSFEAFRLDRGLDSSRASVSMTLQHTSATYLLEWNRIQPEALRSPITRLGVSATLKMLASWQILFGLGQILDGENTSKNYLSFGFRSAL